MGEKKNDSSCRTILWYLVFVGFAVNYMVRINLNIAIVAMVTSRPKTNLSLTSECIPELNLTNVDTKIYQTTIKPLETSPTKFDWNEKEQGHILGSYFWLHWVTQIPGGLLASRYGTKMVYGLSNFAGVVLCMGIPWAAYMGSYYLLLLRTIQGLLTGFAWPAMHNMTARWIPPNERSNFVTSYLGSSVGAALTYPICGFVIDRWGWELVFYICGILGTFWYIIWCLLVFDSPTTHPRISAQERDYIVESLGGSVATKQAPVPWIKILTNIHVWTNILAQWGGVWGLFTLMTTGPMYFKTIHGWNIRATGFLSGMPHLFRMLFAFIFSQLGDYLLRSNKMSRTNVRKLATGVCTMGQGIFMLSLAYSGCDALLAIIFYTASVTIHGAVSTGPLASLVDISPNYASVVLGVINTLVALVGFLTPAVVGYLTFQNQTTPQWQKVFWISSVQLFLCGIFYLIFNKSEVQPWNSPESKPEGPERELMIITRKGSESKEIEKNDEKSALHPPNDK